MEHYYLWEHHADQLGEEEEVESGAGRIGPLPRDYVAPYLPEELLYRIFSHLPIDTLWLSIRSLSRSWKSLVEGNLLPEHFNKSRDPNGIGASGDWSLVMFVKSPSKTNPIPKSADAGDRIDDFKFLHRILEIPLEFRKIVLDSDQGQGGPLLHFDTGNNWYAVYDGRSNVRFIVDYQVKFVHPRYGVGPHVNLGPRPPLPFVERMRHRRHFAESRNTERMHKEESPKHCAVREILTRLENFYLSERDLRWASDSDGADSQDSDMDQAVLRRTSFPLPESLAGAMAVPLLRQDARESGTKPAAGSQAFLQMTKLSTETTEENDSDLWNLMNLQDRQRVEYINVQVKIGLGFFFGRRRKSTVVSQERCPTARCCNVERRGPGSDKDNEAGKTVQTISGLDAGFAGLSGASDSSNEAKHEARGLRRSDYVKSLPVHFKARLWSASSVFGGGSTTCLWEWCIKS